MSNKITDETLNQFELYRQTVERMPVHIYWKDKNFRYINCNLQHAKNAGFERHDDIIGKTDYDLFPKNKADLIRKNDIEVMTNGKPYVFEEPWINKSDENIVFLTQKMPLLNENGKVIGLAGISFNITERKAFEDKIINNCVFRP